MALRMKHPRHFHDGRLKEEAKCQVEKSGITTFPIFRKDVPCVVEIEFYRHLPNDFFEADDRSGPLRLLSKFWNNADTKTPDVDNLSKLYVDAVQDVFFENDCQVVKLIATKMLDVEPPHEGRTLMWVRQLMRSDLPKSLGVAGNNSSNLSQCLVDK
jgi:Holliday junction resolvase RusA-like endonuclease